MSGTNEPEICTPTEDRYVFKESVETVEALLKKKSGKLTKVFFKKEDESDDTGTADYVVSDDGSCDAAAFYLGLDVNGIALRIKVFVEKNPAICRLDVILLANIDKESEYPLCRLLAQKNKRHRLGVFKYIDSYYKGEPRGEVCYQYSFFITNGLTEKTLDTVFETAIRESAQSFEDIKKYADGRFRNAETAEILQSVSDLLDNIQG